LGSPEVANTIKDEIWPQATKYYHGLLGETEDDEEHEEEEQEEPDE